MFLDTVLARNPALLRAAAVLHRRGRIPPDTYVLDLDAVDANAALLAAAAHRHGLSLWFVVKQLGRNPEAIRAIARHIPRYAAIDAADARAVHAAAVGSRPGNLGHLVPVPVRALPELLALRPTAVTVYDLANARAVGRAARRAGYTQDVLVRLESPPGTGHPGQEGGVPLTGLAEFAADAERLPGVRIAGVTAFPCLRADPATGQPAATPGLAHARAAVDLLAARGHRGLLLSAPGVTCAATLPLLAAAGATHGEPGHALTGTTPLHATDPGQPETPAYVYVTEVAHTLPDGRPALFGGGFYARSRVASALLPRSGVRLPVAGAAAGHIDYHRPLAVPAPPGTARTGDTALLAFRTQMFVTRSTVAVLAGLSTGRGRLTGLYDARGRPL
ncbi:alanine racemase [Streptomyces yaizuensis]|uniref:Alanine racemase n=1 Tax=Streptomyces yaizuensis TaxID=2989713 RepID=A0ABQ5P479_9ACTN|nr:alanine racemase [Streptomyces sp. YSPA8]GLF97413.1 alanine racemase [Streptomyces sp. YSPA8]